jgi:hypothetical protein
MILLYYYILIKRKINLASPREKFGEVLDPKLSLRCKFDFDFYWWNKVQKIAVAKNKTDKN